MLRGTRFVLTSAAVAALLLVAGAARAQLLGGATANATQQVNPDRIVNGQNLTQSERPSNLNPTAVSYSDCIRDMTLRFYINLSGFTGQNLQVWATRSNDCTGPLTRGVGSSAATCWQVNGGLTAFQSIANSTQTFDVRVQDLVGPQNAPPYPPNLVHEGASACNVQSSYAAVSMVIWFVPVDSGGNYTSGAYQYPIQVDLQGPPAPSGLSLSVGDTLFQVGFTPNVDTDTIGYDIFIDPIPGRPSPTPRPRPSTRTTRVTLLSASLSVPTRARRASPMGPRSTMQPPTLPRRMRRA